MQSVSAAQAARMLGISLDTLRRWDREGKIEVAARRGEPPRRAGCGDRAPARATRDRRVSSARNRFRGVVRSVEIDGLLARVEIDVTEPSRVVAIITRESAEELGLEVGDERGGCRQVDERDGREVRRAAASCLVVVVTAALASGLRRGGVAARGQTNPRRCSLRPRSRRCCRRSTRVRAPPSAARTSSPSRPARGSRSTSSSRRARSTRRRSSPTASCGGLFRSRRTASC